MVMCLVCHICVCVCLCLSVCNAPTFESVDLEVYFCIEIHLENIQVMFLYRDHQAEVTGAKKACLCVLFGLILSKVLT